MGYPLDLSTGSTIQLLGDLEEKEGFFRGLCIHLLEHTTHSSDQVPVGYHQLVIRELYDVD